MRFIIIGVGAIGGTVAAALALAGHEVIGVARGAHLDAILGRGLTFRTPASTQIVPLHCVASPDQIDLRDDDAILLATKTQDTATALRQLHDAGVRPQPIFCLQNGVANEPMAAQMFADVHGVAVMMPAEYITPGEIAAFGTPNHGIFDIGRFPDGADEADTRFAAAATAAGIAGFVTPTVMRSKYGKLLMNLRNIVQAALGAEAEMAAIAECLRAEGRAVLSAAGIDWQDVGENDPRRATLMTAGRIDGAARVGSSTVQSFARGAGSVETDHLNGEIVRLGRQLGIPTPANSWFTDLAARMIREGAPPGSIPRAEVEAALGLA